ncbi:hypothetical protein OQA88_587 [Cercophora sp. LCS_1]
MSGAQAQPLEPTWRGYINTKYDAYKIIEACLLGQLHHVPRRPNENERENLIQSGNVFVYEENSSGIKRWTDGAIWSPSRILGDFLLYREVNAKFSGGKKAALKKNGVTKSKADASKPYARLPPRDTDHSGDRSLYGSLTDSYDFKPNGLMKKTMAVKVGEGVTHHIVSYYRPEDVKRGQLQITSRDPFLRMLLPRYDIYQMNKSKGKGEDTPYYQPDHTEEYQPPPGFDDDPVMAQPTVHDVPQQAYTYQYGQVVPYDMTQHRQTPDAYSSFYSAAEPQTPQFYPHPHMFGGGAYISGHLSGAMQ